jgi:hypothetical protein
MIVMARRAAFVCVFSAVVADWSLALIGQAAGRAWRHVSR